MNKQLRKSFSVCPVLFFALLSVNNMGVVPSFSSFSQSRVEGLRKVRGQIEITPELVEKLLQEVSSASKETVQALAQRYLPALARLDFASDIDVSAEEGGNGYRDLVLRLIDEIAEKLDLGNPGNLREHVGCIDLTHSPIDSTSIYSPLSPIKILTRINGQFVAVIGITQEYADGFYFLIYYGRDIQGREVRFYSPGYWLATMLKVVPGASSKYGDCREFRVWDGYEWSPELLNWLK